MGEYRRIKVHEAKVMHESNVVRGCNNAELTFCFIQFVWECINEALPFTALDFFLVVDLETNHWEAWVKFMGSKYIKNEKRLSSDSIRRTLLTKWW